MRMWQERKALCILVITAGLLLIAMLIWLLFLNKQLGDVKRFELDLDVRPPAGQGVNILLVGTDDPDWRYGDPPGTGRLFEALESPAWQPGQYRSDAIMVMHLNDDRDSAQLISIPRDSYVPIDSELAGESGRSKINAAFSWGGPELLTQTVEQVTRLRIDHVMVMDFTHFIEFTEAIGGVEIVSNSEVIIDREVMPPGRYHIEGENALVYVRAREGLPRGDFDRVQRQQNFVRATLDKMASTSVLANPVRLTRTVIELSEMVAVDESLTPGRMRSLALSARGLRPNQIRFVTIPHNGTDNVEGAGSIVRLDMAQTRELFAAVGKDHFESWYGDNEVEELGRPNQVN